MQPAREDVDLDEPQSGYLDHSCARRLGLTNGLTNAETIFKCPSRRPGAPARIDEIPASTKERQAIRYLRDDNMIAKKMDGMAFH